MKKLTNDGVAKLALRLLQADSEDEVVRILTEHDLWSDRNLWRLYGDKEGNFAQAGNQQALPEAALVEKIVNCCDSRLMLECLKRDIEPESAQAPTSVRDAVAMFFENRRLNGEEGGSLVDWSASKRTTESRHITLAATGGRPIRGRKSKLMCLTIADQAEGQSGLRLPETILSLNAKNKQRIRFVQGKFNMGGSGALRFCGRLGLQLLISRRNPTLAAREQATDGSVDDWSVTVVRREEPSNKSGEPIHSEFTFLAPIGSDYKPRHGAILRFKRDTMPLMPEHDEAYRREVSWGTAIKLYEYETTVGQSNVLMGDGLLFALERLLPAIALPIRIHECRGYQGDKERSFETPISGLIVRLEDGKGDNLEHGFPLSVILHASGMKMTARVYAFKEDRAGTYLHDEGVIFTINGQAHGHLPKSLFARPKAVGLPRLKDSLLVLVDCSNLNVMQREDLFMSSRDRLSKKPIRYALEAEIEQMLRNLPELKRLQQERREADVKASLSEDKPLEQVLDRILSSSPALSTLFLKGLRLSRPFAKDKSGDRPNGKHKFNGKRHPTFFRVPDIAPDEQYHRNAERGRRVRIRFVTDAENGYFSRANDQGTFALEVVDGSREFSTPDYSLTLEDGDAHLNMGLPSEAEIGDEIVLQASVMDTTMVNPLVSIVRLTVVEQHEHVRSNSKKHKKPNREDAGDNEGQSPQGFSLPRTILVHENDQHWMRFHFNSNTASHVVSDPVEKDGKQLLEHVFYINVDNAALKTEMKYGKQDPRLLEAKFKYANVLLGLAMLHDGEHSGQLAATQQGRDSDDSERNSESVQDKIRSVSTAVAPILIPMIDQLSGISEEQIAEFSETGEDG